ncbi:MAG: hypothetical protein QW358_04815 [Candidatus Hadarchaeum sp.]
MTRDIYLAFFLSVSIFGIAVAILSALYPPSFSGENALRKPLLGLLLGLVCVLGMTATVSPKSCSQIFGSRKNLKAADDTRKKQVPSFQGHHPSCGNFSDHTFKIGDKTICAGCLGFFIGGLVNLVGVFFYFFAGLQLGELALSAAWVGAAGVLLGLLLPLFSLPRAVGRAAVNAFFAVGVFLVIIGVDSVAQDLNTGLLLILLAIFWIFTRISISRWSHEKICQRCQSVNCKLRGF